MKSVFNGISYDNQRFVLGLPTLSYVVLETPRDTNACSNVPCNCNWSILVPSSPVSHMVRLNPLCET